MGEENNNGILFYSDNIVRSIIDTSSRYEVSRPDIVHAPNVSGELTLPDVLDKVLKKTIDGLLNIQIDSYQRIDNNYYGHSSYRYMVNLILTSSNFGIKTKEQLSEMINSSFSVMYPDKDNFRFNVLKVNAEVKNYDEEFFGFFKKK